MKLTQVGVRGLPVTDVQRTDCPVPEVVESSPCSSRRREGYEISVTPGIGLFMLSFITFDLELSSQSSQTHGRHRHFQTRQLSRSALGFEGNVTKSWELREKDPTVTNCLTIWVYARHTCRGNRSKVGLHMIKDLIPCIEL